MTFVNDLTVPDGYIAGCDKRECLLGSEFPVLENSMDLIPRAEWGDLATEYDGLESLESWTYDQRSEGSCASNSAAQAMEIAISSALGKERSVRLSAISLYTRVGRSAGSGSSIPSNISALAKKGILPLNTAENKKRFNHTHPATGFSARLPLGWETTAALFKATEWFDIASFEGIATALLKGYPVCYGRAGHAITAVKLERRGGEWCLKYKNSWGSNWGQNGHGWDTESFCSRSINSYGAYAVRCTKIDYALGDLPQVKEN